MFWCVYLKNTQSLFHSCFYSAFQLALSPMRALLLSASLLLISTDNQGHDNHSRLVVESKQSGLIAWITFTGNILPVLEVILFFGPHGSRRELVKVYGGRLTLGSYPASHPMVRFMLHFGKCKLKK